MRKGLIVGACFLFILIVLMSFASAGWFSNLFTAKITGYDVIMPGDCQDTDALLPYQAGYNADTMVGKNPYLRGTLGGQTDYCVGSYLTENYCYDAGYGAIGSAQTYLSCISLGMVCDSVLDACVPAGTPSSQVCTETDTGKDYTHKGTTTETTSSGPTSMTDSCLKHWDTDTRLEEWYCDANGIMQSVVYYCSTLGMICNADDDVCVAGCSYDADCSDPAKPVCNATTGACVGGGDPCGDEVIDTGEECDDGASNSDILADACRLDCKNPGCGDGVIDTGEECDDENTNNDDGCSDACIVEAGWNCTGEPSSCEEIEIISLSCVECALQHHYVWCTGNGGYCTYETEDEYTYCNSIGGTFIDNYQECPTCGDGNTDPGEECDDGNDVDDDGCSDNCVLPTCSDKVRNGDETGIDCGSGDDGCPKCKLWEGFDSCKDCVPNYNWCAASEICTDSPIEDCLSDDYVVSYDYYCPSLEDVDCKGCIDAGYWWCKNINSGFCGGKYDSAAGGGMCDDVITREVFCACKQTYFFKENETDNPGGLFKSIYSNCEAEFAAEVLDKLPTGYKFQNQQENANIVKILNITSNKYVEGSIVTLILNKEEFGVGLKDLLIYIGEDFEVWEKVEVTGISSIQGSEEEYELVFYAPHLSLFLIVEPELCGNEFFDAGYEDCDGSVAGVTNCTGCVCDAGYNKNASGFCLEDIGGTDCSSVGDVNCSGFNFVECDSNLVWEDKGIVVGNCSVKCLDLDKDCDGEISLSCGLNYDWVIQGNINGRCGYTFDPLNYTPPNGDRCGNGYCNYEEDEYSCPEDCAEDDDGEGPNWGLIALVAGIIILVLVIIIVLFKIFSKERRGGMPQPNRRLPPEHRPGPKRAPGRPLEHNQPVGRPAVQGPYPKRRYPVR